MRKKNVVRRATPGREAASGAGWLAAALLALIVVVDVAPAFAQRVSVNDALHRRGRLWENVWNDGFIGNGCAWDYCTTAPLGMYPGFAGFVHPIGGESNAINTFANANFHNFRSGVWIVAKDLLTPGIPPSYEPVETDYELYAAGAQGETRGIISNREPIEFVENYVENDGFDPLLPEEMTVATWSTNVGVTVTRRTYVWGFPNYDDFIIYDYIFENTGQMVSMQGDVILAANGILYQIFHVATYALDGFAIAAFQEETLFRGFLQGLLRERYGRVTAIVGQSAVFTLAHLGYYPVSAWPLLLVVFLVGLVTGWLVDRRGTLLPAGLAHGFVG